MAATSKAAFCEILGELRGEAHRLNRLHTEAADAAPMTVGGQDLTMTAVDRSVASAYSYQRERTEEAMGRVGCPLPPLPTYREVLPRFEIGAGSDPRPYSGPDFGEDIGEEIEGGRFRPAYLRERDRLARAREAADARRRSTYRGDPALGYVRERIRQKKVREDFLKMSPEERAERIAELGAVHTAKNPQKP